MSYSGFYRLSLFQVLTIDLGTELAPAITLAYEPSERDIMKLPPRKRGEHLMSWPLISYAYLIIASFETAGCFIAYFWVFWLYGINVRDLMWSGISGCGGNGCWPSSPDSVVNATHNPNRSCAIASDSDFRSNGHCFDVWDQDKISREAAAAFHITLVMSQVGEQNFQSIPCELLAAKLSLRVCNANCKNLYETVACICRIIYHLFGVRSYYIC